MGDAKRRKQSDYQPNNERIVAWLPLTNAQAGQFVEITTKGAWAGIGLLVFGWMMVRWIGPALGWWHVVG